MRIDVDTPTPPRLPPLLECAFVLRELRSGRPNRWSDRERLAAACGGLPHRKRIKSWHRHITGTPWSEFPGGPLWYRYDGGEVTRARKHMADEDGNPIHPRATIHPGTVVQINAPGLESRPEWTRIDKPGGKDILSWDEIRSLKISDARAYLAELGITGRSWKALEKGYRGHS